MSDYKKELEFAKELADLFLYDPFRTSIFHTITQTLYRAIQCVFFTAYALTRASADDIML